MEQRVTIICRAGFWIIGLTLASLLAYTNRYFINTDGLTYIEMGEGLRTGDFGKLVNLACSPLYAILLGIAQILLRTTPVTELPLLKMVNVLCFGLSMAACDVWVQRVTRSFQENPPTQSLSIPLYAISTLLYALFLTVALSWVKIRLVNPDMLAFACVLASMTIVLWVRSGAQGYRVFALLGLVLGIGYVTKTYLLVYSVVFLTLAALAAGPVKKAIQGILVATVVLTIVSSPLIGALSYRLGRFSFGEGGSLAYTSELGAQGTPLHAPRELYDYPRVLYFHYDKDCTDAMGFDVAHWSLGLHADFNPAGFLKKIRANLEEFLGSSAWLLGTVGVWLGFLWYRGFVKHPPWWPLGPGMLCMLAGIAGIGLFVFVHLEMRYIAPFVFLFLGGLIVYPEYRLSTTNQSRYLLGATAVILLVIAAMLVHGTLDQLERGILSKRERISYQEAFEECLRVRDFLTAHAVPMKAEAAVVGRPDLYWARLAQVRITARIPDQEAFFRVQAEKRRAALEAIREAGVRIVIGKGRRFEDLTGEGWVLVPGTRDFFVWLQHYREGQ